MNELVSRLCKEPHRVEVRLYPTRTVDALKQRIDRGHVHIRFPDTRGGTEIHLRLDPARTDVSGADFEHGQGAVKLVGDLTLDYVPVRCTVRIDLATLTGQGQLQTV